MEHKVLIADDSLTIQKVIKITLANEPFELSECADAADLVEMVKNQNPAMVLLDFNLSENKTGYDLCREIKSVNPDIGVLMLFGTFDTIDEGLLSDCGCNYHIVKPFDGTKFINLCRALAADFESAQQGQEEGEEDFSIESEEEFEEELPGKIEDEAAESEESEEEESEEESEFGEDEWVVNQPAFEDESEDDEFEEAAIQASSPASNQLQADIEEWGMEIPAIIGKDKDESAVEIPGVIGEAEEEFEPSLTVENEESDDNVLPKSEDLEYPELGVMTDENDHLEAGTSALDDDQEYVESVDMPEEIEEIEEIEEVKPATTSKLVSLDELAPVENMVIEQNDEQISSGGTDTEEGVKNLEDQIRDELEEEEDLWAADIVEESREEEVPSEVSDEQEEEDEFRAFDADEIENVEDIAPIRPHTLRDVSHTGAPADFPEDVMDENIDEANEQTMANFKKEVPGDTASGNAFSAEAMKELGEKIQSEIGKDLEEKLQREIEKEISGKLSPLVEKFVKDYCREQIEKVAWEVIPDLAENIIKKEIQRISDSVMD